MSDLQFLHIERGAHSGAFGINAIPEPSDAQRIAGNYRVGRVSLYGLATAIEQPRGSYRTGIDAKTGKRWACRMAAHYGYINSTKGNDGDCVDVFVGFYPQGETVWVINQNIGGKFDEHKVMLAFPDEASARRAYLDSYERGWKGLASIVACSVAQLKWWLKNGDMRRALRVADLPGKAPEKPEEPKVPEGHKPMTRKIRWNDDALPCEVTLDHVLYDLRRADAGEGLLMDSVTAQEILDDAEGVLALDALVSPYARLERKMELLRGVMERTGGRVKPVAMQITAPFKQRGVANVAVIFELSDGQTVSIYFHNPDVTPGKMAPTDEVISWKWLLNKRDITIVVAPERGADLNIREVARRILRLAEKNSPAFQRANTRRAERMQGIQTLKDEIVVLEKELAGGQNRFESVRMEQEAAQDKKRRTLAAAVQASRALQDAYIRAGENDGTDPQTGLTRAALSDQVEVAARKVSRLRGDAPSVAAGADTPDLTWTDEGLFTRFMPETPAGEDAWRELAGSNDGTGRVLGIHTEKVIAGFRAAGYAVQQAKPAAAASAAEDDALLKALGADAGGELAAPASTEPAGKPDFTTRDDGVFTKFISGDVSGVDVWHRIGHENRAAWEAISSQSGATLSTMMGSGKIPSQFAQQVARQLTDAGYTVEGLGVQTPAATAPEQPAQPPGRAWQDPANRDADPADGAAQIAVWDVLRADALLEQARSAHPDAAPEFQAREFVSAHLQGRIVKTKIGDCAITAASRGKLPLAANRKGSVKVEAIARIPEILIQGEMESFETLYKVRDDGVNGYYPFVYTFDVPNKGVKVRAKVKVAHRDAVPNLVYSLEASLDDVLDSATEKTEAIAPLRVAPQQGRNIDSTMASGIILDASGVEVNPVPDSGKKRDSSLTRHCTGNSSALGSVNENDPAIARSSFTVSGGSYMDSNEAEEKIFGQPWQSVNHMLDAVEGCFDGLNIEILAVWDKDGNRVPELEDEPQRMAGDPAGSDGDGKPAPATQAQAGLAQPPASSASPDAPGVPELIAADFSRVLNND